MGYSEPKACLCTDLRRESKPNEHLGEHSRVRRGSKDPVARLWWVSAEDRGGREADHARPWATVKCGFTSMSLWSP